MTPQHERNTMFILSWLVQIIVQLLMSLGNWLLY